MSSIKVVSIGKSDVPAFLQEGEFYRSLNDEDPFELIEVPANALKANVSVENEEDLVHLLTSLRFWVVVEPQVSIIDFVVQNGATEALRRVLADFIPCFPYLTLIVDHTAEPESYKKLSLIDKSIQCGDHVLMRVLHKRGDELNGNSFREAAAAGNLDCLKYVHIWNMTGCKKINDLVFGVAIQSGSLACVAYLHHYRQGNRRDGGACWSAAGAGHLSILKFFHENGCPWDESVIQVAARGGHLECIRYACEMGCPLGSYAMECAVAEGHYAVVVYLHEQHCPYGAFALELAVHHRRLDILQFLHQQGNVLTEACLRQASERPCAEILLYLHDNGCPVTTEAMKQLAGRDAVECFQGLYERGVRWDESVVDEAAYHKGMKCLKYMEVVDCPAGYAAVLRARMEGWYMYLADED